LRRFEFDIGWAALKVFEKFGLARIIRVAPELEIRPWVQLPDAETVRAVMAHRFEVAKSYFRNVIVPVLRQERRNAGESAQRLAARLRRGLANDGRWLDANAREKLSLWVSERPLLKTVIEYRRRLDALFERSGKNSEALLAALQEWCRDAEASGIEALRLYAQRLRGYSMVPAPIAA
jgi:stearoyl-CoA desaturase (delta-9 desaturase)